MTIRNCKWLFPALYGCAYSIKFARKKAGIEPEYGVQPLEGLWWVEGADPANYRNVPQSQWRWRLLIGQPDFITADDLELAKQTVMKKKARMFPRCDWSAWTKGFVYKFCTSVHMQTNIPPFPRCTIGRANRAMNCMACTTKFIWETHEKPPRRN